MAWYQWTDYKAIYDLAYGENHSLGLLALQSYAYMYLRLNWYWRDNKTTADHNHWSRMEVPKTNRGWDTNMT